MLVIRSKQIRNFRKFHTDSFVETVYAKLRQHWPEKVAEKGETATRDLILKGIRRAARYDIVTEPDVTRYINVMFALGADFDQDDHFPWARELLTYPAVNPTVRMDWLCERTKKELPKIRLRRKRRHG